MKENWKPGNTGDCVVSDTCSRQNADDSHVDYYGGYLVAESIPKNEYVNLIAAAPDLLNACEAGLNALEDILYSEFATHKNPHPEDDDATMSQLRAAIAKARGEK